MSAVLSIPDDITQILSVLKDQMPKFMSEKMVKSVYAEFNLETPRIRLATDKEIKKASMQTWCADKGFEFPEKEAGEFDASNLLPRFLGSTAPALAEKMAEVAEVDDSIRSEITTWILVGTNAFLNDYHSKYTLDNVELKLRDIFLQNTKFKSEIKYHWTTPMIDFQDHCFQIINNKTCLILCWTTM